MWKLKHDTQGAANVRQVIGVVILVIIALLMLPLVVDAVDSAKENVSGTTSETLLDMVPIFYVLGVVLAAVLWVVAETKKL